MRLRSILAATLLVSTASAAEKTQVLNDSWYTMQAASTPWGYFHEKIEQRTDDKGSTRYFYRYEMQKQENGQPYEENMGAIADSDLNPITFNLNKKGTGAMEVINGSYKKTASSAEMSIEVQGGRSDHWSPVVPKGTFLEAFFPVWVKVHFSELTAGKHGSLSILTETPPDDRYVSRHASYVIREKDPSKNCLKLEIELNSVKSLWCLDSKGVTKYIRWDENRVQVDRVAGEKQAKAFLGEKPSGK